MLVHAFGAKCIGIDAVKVTVEIDMTFGIGIHLVGLADVAVKESLLRTTTALSSVGFRVPGKKIVINLAPADLHKKGSGYDLPIAMAVIAASEQRSFPNLGRYVMMGELGLDGGIRPVPGALPVADLAAREGYDGCILPFESALEAMDYRQTSVYGVRTMADVFRILEGVEDVSDLLVWNSPEALQSCRNQVCPDASVIDFSEIIGQEHAKRGAEIAVSGGHNLMLVGSPGSGKSSLAKAISGILPPMTRDEALMVSKIYSVAGRGGARLGLVQTRPFRAPHYSASLAAIIGGGGSDGVVPGEVTLAHSGVLFLDEFGQMPKGVVEALRGPLEDRSVTISRLKMKLTYPASFMLVAASNPCPCGYFGEGNRCTCTPTQRANYLSRLSGPIMDRIDLQVIVRSIPPSSIMHRTAAESSAEIARRVRLAREIQQERFAGEGISCNAEMNNRQIEKYCRLTESCAATMEELLQKMNFSMRAYFRIIKVARTIADMEGSPEIREQHLLEASRYRFMDRQDSF